MSRRATAEPGSRWRGPPPGPDQGGDGPPATGPLPAALAPLSPDEDQIDWAGGAVGRTAHSLWSRLGPWGLAVASLAALLALSSVEGAILQQPAILAAAVAAATSVAVAWSETGHRRLGWGAIGAASVLWCAGSEARPMWEGSGVHIAMTAGDVAAIGSVLAFGVGILALLDVPHRRVAVLRFAAEGLLVAASIMFAGWVVLLPPAFAATASRSLGEQFVLLAYPISDVLVLGVVAFALTKLPRIGRSSLGLLLGIGAIAVLSSAVGIINPSETAQVDTVGLATALAFIAVITAAVQAWHRPDPDDAAVAGRTQILLLSAPGLSVLIVVGTTLRQVIGEPVADELTWITIGVLTLSVLLHITVVAENHTLGAELGLARDEAIRASELKSRFLANVSHEIRTPMNAVIGLTGLLLDTELENDQRELAVGVATSAEGLLGLIDEVLDFSKIEAERMDLEDIELDLTDLIDEVAIMISDGARRKGIELVAYCEPGMVTARRGDPVRLRQILLNLANNAVKFTDEGSVTIQAMPASTGANHVALLVLDTGMGIPEADQVRLFEPFSQLDGSTTRTHGGTGLGLSIVRGLVELQNGTIEVASEEGLGTAFRVTLPLPACEEHPTERGLAALVGLRALVVNPNAVNRSVLAHTLHSWGFVVDQAENAEEALHQYGWAEGPPHYAVVIAEQQMEGLDGIGFARLLRSHDSGRDSVLLLLASDMRLSREAARDAGIDSVLIKPVRTSYLLRRIVDALITQPANDSDQSAGHRKEPDHATRAAR